MIINYNKNKTLRVAVRFYFLMKVVLYKLIYKNEIMKAIHLLGISICALLIACSSPLDKKFNEQTVKNDMLAVNDKLDSIELGLLAGSIFRLKFQKKNLEEMTYGEILEEGKKWKATQDKIQEEQRVLTEKALIIEKERTEKLSKSVLVSCFDKGYSKIDYEDFITYKFIIKNKSNKNIRAIKGNITFENLFDETIKSLNFVYDQPIKVGDEVNYNAQTDYNQFNDSDKALRNKDLKDIKVIWKPEKIIFEDGSILE